MSVKDVLTSLVDDGLVDSDKIGTSVYFWAFPSKATQVRKRKIETSTENLETVGDGLVGLLMVLTTGLFS